MPLATKRAAEVRVREAHVHWIDLEPFDFGHRVVWKVELGAAKTSLKGGKKRVLVQVGERDESGAPNGLIEFEFGIEELVDAWKEMSTRRKEDGDYGDPADFGDLKILRQDRYDYQIVADCGDTYDIRGGALKKLVEKICDMPVSTKMP